MNKEERNEFISNNVRLVAFIIDKYFKDYIGTDLYEDIFQEGCLGLIKAADRFNIGKGCTFSTYASSIIVGTIKSYLNTCSHTIRPTRTALNEMWKNKSEVDYDSFDPLLNLDSLNRTIDGGDDRCYDLIEFVEDKRCNVESESIEHLHFNDVMSKFTEQQKDIILSCISGNTQMCISRKFNLSQAQISRIFTRFKKEYLFQAA